MLMCPWVQNRIPAFLSGELGARQAKLLSWHLKQCHVCRKTLDVLRATHDLLKRALAVEVQAPDTLDARVMAAIRALPPVHAPPRRPPRFRIWWRR